SDSASFLQRENTVADASEIFERPLKEVVARESVEDVLQRFAAMAAWVDARLLDELRHLQTQQRNVARQLVVGGGREEAEEAPLRLRPSLRVEDLDADVVERRGPMDPRDRIRLRDDERLSRSRLLAGG